MAAILTLSGGVFASELTSSFDLTLVGSGARSISLGRAYSAIADDPAALFTNPAGLGGQKEWGMTSMTSKLLDRVDYKLLGVIFPTEIGTVGLGYVSAATPAGYLTTDKASISAPQAISYSSSMLILSYGKNISDAMRLNQGMGRLYVGANLKTVADNFSGTEGTGSGNALDLGLTFKPNSKLTTALTLKNVASTVNWTTGTTEKLPKTINLGAAYAFDKVLTSADLELASGSSLFHGGVEYQPSSLVTFRAGIEQAPIAQGVTATDLTGGIGLKLNGISFDYAYRQDGTLGENSTHFFSISFQQKKDVVEVSEIEERNPFGSDEYLDGLYKVSTMSKNKNRAAQSDASIMTSKKYSPENILSYYEDLN